MPLPAAVARKAERATDLIRQASGVPASTATPATPAAGDVAALQKQIEQLSAELKKANEALASLQGKYNAEIPRTAGELRQTKAELKKAEERVKELQGQLTKKAEAFQVNSLDENERSLLGDSVIRATAKIAREAAEQAIAGSTKFQELEERIDVFERMTDEAYIVTLDERVPDWERVNNDPAFVAWCNQPDPNTKRSRLDALKRAEALRQGHRVAEVFLAYKEGREIGVAKAAQPQPDPQRNRAEPQAGGADTTGAEHLFDDAGKRIWRRSEIKAFYDSKRAGTYRGPEGQAEAAKIENDIFAAQREGRVRAG